MAVPVNGLFEIYTALGTLPRSGAAPLRAVPLGSRSDESRSARRSFRSAAAPLGSRSAATHLTSISGGAAGPHSVLDAAARTRGVAAGRSAQREARSSDWRRGAAGSPDPENLPHCHGPKFLPPDRKPDRAPSTRKPIRAPAPTIRKTYRPAPESLSARGLPRSQKSQRGPPRKPYVFNQAFSEPGEGRKVGRLKRRLSPELTHQRLPANQRRIDGRSP
jgi:hypothetical protein